MLFVAFTLIAIACPSRVWAGPRVRGEQVQELDEYGEPKPEPKPEPEPKRKPTEVLVFPFVLASLGGGAYVDKRIGVFGGDTLVGFDLSATTGEGWGSFMMTPNIGWSGWRTLDAPSRLRASTFTGRLDLGYRHNVSSMGFLATIAGRVGNGRGPEPDRPPARLSGAQVGATWRLFDNIVSLECQVHFTRHLGEWNTDIRAMATFNLAWIGVGIWAAGLSRGLS